MAGMQCSHQIVSSSRILTRAFSARFNIFFSLKKRCKCDEPPTFRVLAASFPNRMPATTTICFFHALHSYRKMSRSLSDLLHSAFSFRKLIIFTIFPFRKRSELTRSLRLAALVRHRGKIATRRRCILHFEILTNCLSSSQRCERKAEESLLV